MTYVQLVACGRRAFLWGWAVDLGAVVHALPGRALEGAQVAISCPFCSRIIHIQAGRISPGRPRESQALLGLMRRPSGGVAALREAAEFAGPGALVLVAQL